MDYRSLIFNLESEVNMQNQLLALVREEKVALSLLDEGKINAIVDDKSKILERISKNKEERDKIFIKDTLAPLETLRLEDIIANCSSAIYSQKLVALQNTLREIVTEMRALNEHNANLTKQSLGLIATTLTILQSSGLETQIPTYTPRPSLLTKDSTSLVLQSNISKSV